MTNGTSEISEYIFRRNDSIGAPAAEEDSEYLSECFVDTGDLERLFDCKDTKRIVIGRTGAGKSALLNTVSGRAERVIRLSPHSLSLNYIANNDVIRFFEEVGVTLTPFYILLWKHILVVELLKERYQIKNEDSQKSAITRLCDLLSKKDQIKSAAVKYLEEWENKFWLTTEQRITEITTKVANTLCASLNGEKFGIPLSAETGKNLSVEQRTEILQRGKRAVSEVQIRELEAIIEVLNDEVFNDSQGHYYLTIDALDEEWVDDRIRYKLIKALIDTVRSFCKVENIKIIVALRQDLLDKVLHSTTDPGFQAEKYESLYLKWNQKDLVSIADRRLNQLMKRKYTNKPITLSELLPTHIDGGSSIEYMLNRTFMRPRDLLMFINECIAGAEGCTGFTANVVKQAEEEYSHKRLESLSYEWVSIYPNLKTVALMFYGMKESFELNEISREWLEDKYVEVLDGVNNSKKDTNIDLLNALCTPQGNFNSIRNTVIRNLFGIGLLGIKGGPTSTVLWSNDARLSVSPGELRPNSVIYVHPMFHRVLGIRY